MFVNWQDAGIVDVYRDLFTARLLCITGISTKPRYGHLKGEVMNPKFARKVALFAICSLSLIGSALPQQNDASPVAGTVTLGVTVEQIDLVTTGWRASKLLHATVYNDSNEKIGTVGDLIVAPDGSLSVAIVDVGGFLRMGTHHVAIPVEKFSGVTPKIILPGATKDALKQLPEFRYSKS